MTAAYGNRHLDGIYRRAALCPPVSVVSVVAPPGQHKRIGHRVPKRVVWGVRVFTVACCLYILVTPFVPELFYREGPSKVAPAPSAASSAPVAQTDTRQLAEVPPVPIENKLVIPKIGVDAAILEGDSEAVLDKGIWRRPVGSTPDKGSNTVLTAHRFKYLSGPNTFYNLDKLALGDTFDVIWSGVTRTYKVSAIHTVTPKQTEIENATDEPIVTLYTCTPLWTSTKRLVVVATLVR